MEEALQRDEERRVVTVLFADLVGSTSSAEVSDPEEVGHRLGLYHAGVREEIERLGGVVEKFIGDAVMGLFGAPVARGDDAELAVRAGFAVLSRLAALNEADPGLELRARIGINTGEALVVLGARPELGEAMAAGDVVNTASRLQGAAEVGGILVGQETYRATRRSIRYEGPIAVQAKGKQQPVSAWIASGPAGPDPGGARRAGPFLGRDDELAALRALGEKAQRARIPMAVTVLGPPGVGKTRLSLEFISLIGDRGFLALQGRSLPHETVSYGAFTQQVFQLAGIFETDSPEVARSKLEAAIEGLGIRERGDLVPQLALLAGLETDLTVGDRQTLFHAARHFVEAVAAKQPTVFVFEDLHWAYPSLLDLVEFLVSRTEQVPAVFLTLARAELRDVRPTWGSGATEHRTIELGPLGASASRELAYQLLAEPEDRFVDHLLATAGGNPLFIEELAAAELGRTGEDARKMPTNVRTAIAARLDALPASARARILDASVVGKIFWRGALEALSGDGDVGQATDALLAQDLIRAEPTSALEGDQQFIFKHMLIREVAYSMLPRAARRERHRTVARFIEDAAGARLVESASFLAHHWREAAESERAVDYLLIAADRARRGWAKAEAASLYAQALELLPERDERRPDITLHQALAHSEGGDYASAAALLDPILPDLRGSAELEGLLARMKAAFWLMDAAGARGFGDRLAHLAAARGDSRFSAPAMSLLSHTAGMEGETAVMMDLGEAALSQWLPDDHPSDLAYHLELLGLCYYWTGRYARSVELLRAAYEAGKDLYSVEASLRAGATLGLSLGALGHYGEALSLADEVVARGRELEVLPRWTARALNMSSQALRDLCAFEEARERNEEAIELSRRADFALAEVQSGIDLLLTDLALGEVGRAETAWPRLWKANEGVKGFHQWLMAGRLTQAKAEIALASGRTEAAIEEASVALENARRHGRLKHVVAARLVLGSAFAKTHRLPHAVRVLREAAADAELLRSPPFVWRTASELGRALGLLGHDGEAADAYRLGKQAIEETLMQVPDDRKTALRSAPAIAEVLRLGS